MKVLYFYPYYYPEEVAFSHFNDESDWKDTGIQRLIITPRPTRGIDDATYRKYKHIRKEVSADGQTIVCRFAMFREGRNPVQRALRYTLCLFQYLRYGLMAKDCDMVCCGSTPPIQGLVGAIVKMCKHIPFVYELQDIFPDSLVGAGLARKDGILWKIGRAIENFTYRHADKIIVISEGFKRNIMAKGVPEEKIVVNYNCVDEKAVVDIPREENKLFDKYGLDRKKFYVTYNGNIGLTQNMDMLLEVMEKLQEESRVQSPESKEIHLVLVGEGAYKKRVEEIVKEKNLQNVHLLPFQPYEDISHVFSLGDASLVISKPGVGANSVPSKTWSIMSASRPVLTNFDPNELKDIVEGTHPFSKKGKRCGIFTQAGDKEAFKQSILELYNNRSLCEEYGRNGRVFILKNLTKRKGVERYIDVMKNCIQL